MIPSTFDEALKSLETSGRKDLAQLVREGATFETDGRVFQRNVAGYERALPASSGAARGEAPIVTRAIAEPSERRTPEPRREAPAAAPPGQGGSAALVAAAEERTKGTSSERSAVDDLFSRYSDGPEAA